MISMDIRFEPGSMERLRAAMRRVETELGRSSGTALRWAARAVALSVGASTVISKEHRAFERSTTPARKDGKIAYNVTFWKGGKSEIQERLAKSEADLRARVLKIKRRGLASRMWNKYLAPAAGRGSGRSGYYAVSSKTRAKDSDQFVTMTNSLRYAAIAVKPAEVTTALDRAARGVIQRLEQTLAKQGAA